MWINLSAGFHEYDRLVPVLFRALKYTDMVVVVARSF